MTSVLPTRSSNRVTWWERIAHATMLPFKIMLVLCVGLAWLACRAVYATDEASGHHRQTVVWPKSEMSGRIHLSRHHRGRVTCPSASNWKD